MKNILLVFYFLLLHFFCYTQFSNVTSIKSPSNIIVATVGLDSTGHLFYNVKSNGAIVLQNSKLGIIRNDANFDTNLKWKSSTIQTTVFNDYKMLTAKKSSIRYKANKKTISILNKDGLVMQIIFQVSNDGVAFQYFFPGKDSAVKKIISETTSFHFNENSKAWLQPKTEAQSGWEHTNPSYEAHYMMDINTGTPAPDKNGWVYPALFYTNNTWVLITEAALGRNYCGTALQQYSEGSEYKINFPQDAEKYSNGVLLPQSTLPWFAPWRIITIGSLQTIAESTLGTDLALPAVKMNKNFIKPGRASWSWIMSKDNFIVYDEQKKYIDYAADMHWEYCLIDVAWDKKIGYDKISELSKYAALKKVGLILWYNSAGDWNTVKYTPKNKLLTHESRVAEFAILQKMGIKGIKADFFSGDGQSIINYYQDILIDAAEFNLLVNFHGATLPRGWHRTYPNLMTTEAVYGYEMITFNQKDADVAPAHMVMSAFARNAFDPMDFTPVSLYKIPKITKKTSTVFELATSVIFLSGIQHFVESPDGMAKMPLYVKEFMQNIPSNWDDVKFIDGYPGKYYVVARRAGSKWYVTGINADASIKIIKIDFSFLKNNNIGTLYYTIENGEVAVKKFPAYILKEIEIKPNDGFVIEFEK